MHVNDNDDCGMHDFIDPPDECAHCLKEALKHEKAKVSHLLDMLEKHFPDRILLHQCASKMANRTRASEWVFMLNIECESEDEVTVYVSPRKHWEEEGYIPDRHCGMDFMPDTWIECMDHAYEPRSDILYTDRDTLLAFARKEFKEAGLEEVKWADGEAARHRKYLEEMAEDGLAEDDGRA